MGAESSLIREPSTVINMAFRQDDTEDTMDGFNSVSSPGQSSRAVPNLTTSKSEVSPWKPDFLKLRLPHLRVGGQPDVFILRSRINDIHQPLTVIDTISDGETYLDMTRGQWDMAIKKARAKDNVLEKLKDGNSPAGQENIRYPQHSLTSGLENSQVRSVPKKVVNHNFPQHIVGIPNQEYWGSATRLVPAHNNPPGRAPLYSNPAWMGDLCEESYNDSELVKGVGRVIINRKILALVPFIDKPYELLPPSFALRDDLYPLEHMLSSDLKVLNHKIFPAAQVPYDLSLPQALILQWNGKTKQQITVFKVNEIKSINFKDIIKINYNLELWSILIQFSSDQTDKAEELLLAIRPNLLSTWMILQTCCYSITKGKVNGPKCGGASKEFFDDKTKELQKLRIKRAPVSSIPQIIDRGKSRTRTPRSLLSILRSQIRQTARRNMLPFRSSSAQLPIRSVSRLSKLPTSHMSAPPVVHGEAGDIDKSLEDLFREKSSLDSALKSAGDHSHSQASDTDDSLEDLFREKISPDSALNSAGDRSHSQEQDIIPSQCFSNTGAVYMEAADMEINVEQSGLQDEAEAEHDPPHSSKQNSPNIEKDMVRGDSVTTPAAGNAPQRAPSVYYKQSLKYGSLVPVEVNDLVVRLRKERYKEIGGKRDKTDIFDGPWRVTEFGTPDKIYGMSHDGTGPGQYSDVEFKRMLTTRVRLDFPKASVAPRWVQIAQLLPVYEPEIAYDGELYASSWAVSKLRAFKEIQKIIQERKGDTEAPATDEEALPTDVCEDADDEIFHDGQVTIFVAKIKRGVFVAVTQCDPQGPMEGVYEVEKLRRKRLRLYPANSPMVKKQKLKTDKNDPWVQRLRKQLPRLTNKRVIVAEYNVHWTAWPDEDDEWTTGAGNIPQVFIDEYHSLTDPFRDIPMDIDLANPLEMIFGDDLQTERKARKGKARKSTGGGGRQSGLLGNNMEGLEQIHEPQNDYGETLGDEKITARSEAAQAFSEPGEGQKAVDDLDSFHRDIGVEAEDPAGLIDHENEDGEDDENVVMADNEFEDGNEDEDEI